MDGNAGPAGQWGKSIYRKICTGIDPAPFRLTLAIPPNRYTTMSAHTSLTTGNPELDSLTPRIRGFLEQDTLDLVVDGQDIRGYRSPDCPAVWLRDHSDMMRGFRHFETDLTSAVQHFADTQATNGRIYDFYTDRAGIGTGARENWMQYVRVPVEADVEYRFLKAAFLAWQASGDDDWIRRLLPSLERALQYAFEHPHRWDPGHGLVKRAYTIDSWDFAYTAGRHPWLQFQIDEHTFWGILHGDNSGYFEACQLLSRVLLHLGKPEQATRWRTFAEGLADRLNAHCWNGRFYTHFKKITPVEIPGVDEAAQLSFSNPMNINRGVTDLGMARSILQEYQERRNQSGAFAEWFSIDPAFPDGAFGDEKLVAGAYCNGGILPLVGGELARAYLESGYEEAGVRTLRQYARLIAEKGETFLWYFPDGRPSSIETSTSPDAMPTDGWGSSAMLWALIEGLAGVQDKGRLMNQIRLCPRWNAAQVDSAEVRVGYAASGVGLGYAYALQPDGIQLDIESPDSQIDLHLLLPEGARVREVSAGPHSLPFSERNVADSRYLDCRLPQSQSLAVRLRFA